MNSTEALKLACDALEDALNDLLHCQGTRRSIPAVNSAIGAVRAALAQQPQPSAEPANEGPDFTAIAFEAWWRRHGEFIRAGGGDYEKCFAWGAWQACAAIPCECEFKRQHAAALPPSSAWPQLQPLTEADVRRIVRDELAKQAAEKGAT